MSWSLWVLVGLAVFVIAAFGAAFGVVAAVLAIGYFDKYRRWMGW